MYEVDVREGCSSKPENLALTGVGYVLPPNFNSPLELAVA